MAISVLVARIFLCYPIEHTVKERRSDVEQPEAPAEHVYSNRELNEHQRHAPSTLVELFNTGTAGGSRETECKRWNNAEM